MHVKTNIFHGNLEKKIDVKQPDDFLIEGKEKHVCRLINSLYGLKSVPR